LPPPDAARPLSPRLPAQPQVPLAQVMDFLFEKWKLYGDQCLYNLSLLPPPTELVCNRTFDKYSCWPDTPPNTTASTSCPWYLPWHHKVQHRLVFKKCGPDGQWVRGPRGQPWRNASQCQMDDEEIEVQKDVAKMYSSFQVMYTVGYSLSLGALLLALATLLGLRKLHCTRNYIHANLFASFVLKASSVLVIDTLLKTRYSQKIGDDLSVSLWLSDGALLRPPRVGAGEAQAGRGLAPPCRCWTSNGNMGFWWILRFPVFLATLINFFIFIRVLLILVAKLRARQMRYTDYKFRPLLGVHEVVFAFVTDEHAQGTLRSAKLFFDLFLSSFQGLLVAVLYCFLNKEVQSELLRRWHRWHVGNSLQAQRHVRGPSASARPGGGPPSEKPLLSRGGGGSNGASQDPSAETCLVSSLPGAVESPF
ncbi:GLR protein, partial [Crocuta crocuta]